MKHEIIVSREEDKLYLKIFRCNNLNLKEIKM